MKTWMSLVVIAFLGLTTVKTFAASFDVGLNHRAIPDKLVKRGNVIIQTRDLTEQSEMFETRIKYNFTIEILFSTRQRTGEEVFKLPISFREEQGYFDLEANHVYEDSQIKMIHQGRKDWRNGKNAFYDCHFVKLIPKYKDTWDGEFFYCPSAPKNGIIELRFRVKNIPFRGPHTIVSRWQDN